jgi:hypothetical protein
MLMKRIMDVEVSTERIWLSGELLKVCFDFEGLFGIHGRIDGNEILGVFMLDECLAS